MKFSWYIARRYLRSRRHSRFLSRISLIAVLGIVLGVMVLDLTLAIMNGFHAELRRSFVDNMPMITVVTTDPEGFHSMGALVDSIGQVSGVTGVAPFIRQEVILTSREPLGGQRNRAAVAWGIEPYLQDSVTPLRQHLWPGPDQLRLLTPLGPGEPPGLVLGRELAAELYVTVGDTVVMTAPRGDLEQNLESLEAESRRFLLVGLLDTGMYEFDSTFAYLDLQTARSFFGYGPEGASGIGVKLRNMMAAPATARLLEEKLGPTRFRANDWIGLNRNLFQWIKIEKIVMFLLLAMIVLVAAVNIIGILTMMVGERRREIGILLSMGAHRSQIQGVFMLDGLFLGVVGVLVGSLLGWLGTVYLARFGFKLPSDVYFIDHVPVVAQWGDFLSVAGATLLITLAATLVPSHEAARLKPMEIIRYT
jgi:lipoprotein-releasing system permease protein